MKHWSGCQRNVLRCGIAVFLVCGFVVLTSGLVFARDMNREAEDRVAFGLIPDAMPVCNDGVSAGVQTFTLKGEREFTLTGVTLSLEGTTDLNDIEEIGVVWISQAGDVPFASTKKIGLSVELEGKLIFKASDEHRLQVRVRTKKNADLLHLIGAQLERLEFADGQTMSGAELKNTGTVIAPRRLAYPIHRQGDFDCHTFRIPGIARANNGDLLAVYDMRYNSRRDLQEHIDIGLSRSRDGGQTWEPPRPIMDMGEFGDKPQNENGCSDPGILVDTATGEIFVAACWTHGKPNTHQWSGRGSEPGLSIQTSTQFMVVRSGDDGETWGKPENWTKMLKDPKWYLFAPAPGNGITLKNGTLVFPTQGRDEKGHPFSNLTWSNDHGKTWNVSSAARDDTTECSVAELSKGELMLNMRDNRNRRIKDKDGNGRAVSTTDDLGESWKVHLSDHSLLPEPTCMASLIGFEQRGRHRLFFSNPRNKTRRAGMTVQMSDDDGKTWKAENRILLDSLGGAYSSLVMIDDKTIGILYESSVADFVFQKIPLSDFEKAAKSE